MQSPPAPRPHRTIIVSLALLALVVAGFLVWRHGRTPGTDEVAAFLDRAKGRRPAAVFRRPDGSHRPRGESGLGIEPSSRQAGPPDRSALCEGRHVRLSAPDVPARSGGDGGGAPPVVRKRFFRRSGFPWRPRHSRLTLGRRVIVQVATPADAAFTFKGVIGTPSRRRGLGLCARLRWTGGRRPARASLGPLSANRPTWRARPMMMPGCARS